MRDSVSPGPNAPAVTKPEKWAYFQAAVILAAGWFVYSPALRGDFLWDDRIDLVENELLRNTSGLWKIWTQPTLLFDFYPLKHTVQWMQWQLWGSHTLGYHVTNLALHLLGALLFWRVLAQLGLRLAWLGALAFTVHPIVVESVAWIAELKNTLSLPPLLLATSACLAHADRAKRRDLWIAVAWFLVAMLCKTSVVMFPATLLLVRWWKRGRLTLADAKVTAPFFVISLVLGLVTVWFQQHRAIDADPFPTGGVTSHIAVAGLAGADYFWKCVWPAGLMPIYPRWAVDPPAGWQFLPWLALGAALGWCWRRRATWGRHALFGLGWFALHLAPFVGLVTISYMRYTWVMDHLAYVPLLGLIALAVAAPELVPARQLAATGGIAVCALLAWQARAYAGIFRDEEALWTFTVAHNPGAWVAHYNLGLKLSERGEAAAARLHYETAIRLAPDYAPAHVNLGNLLHAAGQVAEAEREFETALRCKPTSAEAHNSLGNLLREVGRVPEAIPFLETAIHLDPGNATACNNLALALDALGRPDPAIRWFEQALRLRPGYAEAHSNFASLLRRLGRTSEAYAHFREALRLQPNSPVTLYNLGNLQRQLRQTADSIASYEQALRFKPDLALAHHNLALSLRDAGRTAEANTHYAEARRLDPTLPDVRF